MLKEFMLSENHNNCSCIFVCEKIGNCGRKDSKRKDLHLDENFHTICKAKPIYFCIFVAK